MSINIGKSKLVTFNPNHRNPARSYKLGNTYLEKVQTYKYLGVTFSDDLSWNSHIHNVTSGACKTLGVLRRKLYLASRDVKLIAYKTFIRPKLEYASLIWWPHQIYLINILERIQNKAARFISRNYSQRSSVTRIKYDLSLTSLANKSTISRLVFLHNTYYNESPEREVYTKSPTFITARSNHTQENRANVRK